MKSRFIQKMLVLTVGVSMQSVGLAGINMDLKFEHQTTVRFEPVMVQAQIVNDTDYPFVVDYRQSNRVDDIWLELSYGRRGEATELRPKVLSYIYLTADEGQEIRFDLSRIAHLGELGSYYLRLAARTPSGVVVSDLRRLEVVKGYELLKKSRTVPEYADMMRTYTLLYWARESREYLFLSVDDTSDGLNYGVFELGPLVRVQPPTLDVARDGTITVFHQSAYRRFSRTILKSTRDGVTMVDQTYQLPDGSPYPKEEEKPKPLKLKEPEKRWWQFWK